ncbi:MAG: UPF0102 protein [Bacteroidia bacterium]|nr:MAG: UPF0102 protein [Bacteroidia bacterium]
MEGKNHNEIGNYAEELACNYLMDKGFSILERNWRYKHLEVDIIAEKSNLLIVVEVKFRSSTLMGEPEVFVNRQKQKFLIEAVNQYILQKNIDKEVRFDIVAITKKRGEYVVNHIEDAFYAR